MKLLPLLLFLPLALYCQSPLEQEFLQFYNRMLEYKDSIGHDEQFVYPLDLSELNCEDWQVLWIVEEPGRNISRKTGKELCKEWKELQKRSARKGTLFPFDINWAVQLVGDRYLVFTDQSRISSISQGKTWYFSTKTDLPTLSGIYPTWQRKGLQGHNFPLSDKLELLRDQQSKAYEDFRKMEELSMFSSFRLPLSKTELEPLGTAVLQRVGLGRSDRRLSFKLLPPVRPNRRNRILWQGIIQTFSGSNGKLPKRWE